MLQVEEYFHHSKNIHTIKILKFLYDNRNNVACTLGDRGNFICGGESVDPGWRINVGTENYQRIVDDQRFRGPLSTVAKWTFQFAFFSCGPCIHCWPSFSDNS